MPFRNQKYCFWKVNRSSLSQKKLASFWEEVSNEVVEMRMRLLQVMIRSMEYYYYWVLHLFSLSS